MKSKSPGPRLSYLSCAASKRHVRGLDGSELAHDWPPKDPASPVRIPSRSKNVCRSRNRVNRCAPHVQLLVGSGQQATRLRERGEQPRKAGKAAFPSRSFANDAQPKRRTSAGWMGCLNADASALTNGSPGLAFHDATLAAAEVDTRFGTRLTWTP